MADVFIGLGCNLGDRSSALRRVLSDFRHIAGIEFKRVSRFYVTDPVGGPPQPDYLNAVARLESRWEPWSLLSRLQQLEDRFGRRRSMRNGPRTMDLDLLWADGVQLNLPFLQLPHPRMLERLFVLEPFAEIAPQAQLQPGRTAEDCLFALKSCRLA